MQIFFTDSYLISPIHNTQHRALLQSTLQLCYLYLAVFSHPYLLCCHLEALFPVLSMLDLKCRSITILFHVHNHAQTLVTMTQDSRYSFPLVLLLPYFKTNQYFQPSLLQLIFIALPAVLFK